MRQIININKSWRFIKEDISYENALDKKGVLLDLPHTWNNKDGQDGGGDYVRSAFWYFKRLDRPKLIDGDKVYLEILACNSSAEVYVNGRKLFTHDGGYSLFRVNITEQLMDKDNIIAIKADNKPNDYVYPQHADFTFYGGLYRGVNLLIVPKVHFDVDYLGDPGLRCDAKVNGNDGILEVSGFKDFPLDVDCRVIDREGKEVAFGKASKPLVIKNVHLWNGLEDPYLYTVEATANDMGKESDVVKTRVGFRTFKVDSRKGFILNGRNYPLRGVSRHQDFAALGNAITEKEMKEDINLIKEVGANTVRLAHYQHSQRFYELCDEAGLVVWSEIPYISKHMNSGNANAMNQMKELIVQTYNNPSIVCRGLSNEITMKSSTGKTQFHKELNDLVHKMDPYRLTAMANFAMMLSVNPFCRIVDVTSMNFYHGWYTPWTSLNGIRLSLFHFLFPNKGLGFSEYGAEGMPSLHSEHPKRGDNSEEYQFLCYHKIYKSLSKRPYLWATHLWNMFDFAADSRNVGGDPGKNHKGLVTFDRKIKKDSFYLYKAFWSKESFVHLTGHRFTQRADRKTKAYVMTNQKTFKVLQDGKEIYSVTDGKEVLYKVNVILEGKSKIEVISGNLHDEIELVKVSKPNPDYSLKVKSNNSSWEKKKK